MNQGHLELVPKNWTTSLALVLISPTTGRTTDHEQNPSQSQTGIQGQGGA